MPQVKIRIENTDDNQAGVGNASATSTKDDKKKVSATTIFTNQMIATAKQTMNFAINNIGNFTGDYIAQSKAQELVSFVGDVVSIVTGALVSPAAAVVAVAGLAVKQTFETISDIRKNQLSERPRSYLIERSGNATKNGSRGTEN